MRQTLTLIPLLAMGPATTCLAQESGNPPPAVTLGALALSPYGQFDQFVGRSVSNSNDASPGVAPGQRSKVDLLNGGLSTSNIGLKGRAKIAESTDVIFDLSTFVNPEGGSFGRSGDKSVTVAGAAFGADPLFSRAANIGFDNAELGALKFGTDIEPLFFSIIKSNAFGDSMMFGPLPTLMFINSGISGGTNWQKAIFYDSKPLGGLAVRLAYSFGDEGSAYVSPAAANDAAAHAGRNYGASLIYSGGPFGASLNWQKVNRNGVIGNFSTAGMSVDNTSAWLVGASYNFGAGKIYAHGGEMRDDSSASSPFYAARQKIWDVSMSLAAGQGDVLLGIARRSVSSGTPSLTPEVAITEDGAPGGNDGRTMATVGYNYHLFKSTDLYALLSSDRTHTGVVNTSNGSVSNSAASATNFAIGGRFSF